VDCQPYSLAPSQLGVSLVMAFIVRCYRGVRDTVIKCEFKNPRPREEPAALLHNR